MTRADRVAWLKSLAPMAQESQRVHGVPASVTLAQAALESGWGQSQLAKLCKNFFGIKASSKPGSAYREFPTREVVGGKSVKELAKFQVFDSIQDCFNRHAELISENPRYARAMAVCGRPDEFAAALQTCGYSTDNTSADGDPPYAAKLNAIIVSYALTQYDAPQPKAVNA